MSENYLYILMRTDLPSLGVGRAAAQASHASNAFIHRFGTLAAATEWSQSTPQGFGTAIVLGTTLDELRFLLDKAGNTGFLGEAIIDPDYAISISSELVPFLDKSSRNFTIEPSATDPKKVILHRSETTCGYIFGNKEQLQPLLGDIPLYS